MSQIKIAEKQQTGGEPEKSNPAPCKRSGLADKIIKGGGANS